MNALAGRIDSILGNDTPRLVAAFFDTRERFAGATFDRLGENPPDRFVPDDLLAASLLDVGFLPRAVRGLLVDDERVAINQALADIPEDVDLWDADDHDLKRAEVAWKLLRELDGVGPTRTSKLLARKRPRLVPVVDSLIRSALPELGTNSWEALRRALRDDPGLRDNVDALRPASATGISTLRVLDAALWMNLSNSVHVRKVRERPAG